MCKPAREHRVGLIPHSETLFDLLVSNPRLHLGVEHINQRVDIGSSLPKRRKDYASIVAIARIFKIKIRLINYLRRSGESGQPCVPLQVCTHTQAISDGVPVNSYALLSVKVVVRGCFCST